MIDKNQIKKIAGQYLTNSPNYLTDISVSGDNTIVVEIDNDEGVDIDDCVSLSRHIESRLDRDTEDYELTVTSAGLTTPFKTPRQYKKYEGEEVEVLSKNGQKIVGILQTSDDTGFIIKTIKKVKPEGAKRKIEIEEETRFSFDEIKYTKYLLRFK